ncbi:MAG: hypothetical protein CNLJKLNK_01426 [Holosporales bacterium]
MKKRFSRIEKEKLLDDFDQSGIKQASFSRLNNLNPKTLSRWLADRQMERIGKEKDFNQKLTGLFMPVVIEDTVKKADSDKVLGKEDYLNLNVKGFCLEIPSDYKNTAQLSQIIKILHAL